MRLTSTIFGEDPDYLPYLPVDPHGGVDDAGTGYYIAQGSVIIVAVNYERNFIGTGTDKEEYEEKSVEPYINWGSPDNPFPVGSFADLKRVGSSEVHPNDPLENLWSLDAHYVQEGNINADSSHNFKPIGAIDNPEGPSLEYMFTGSYDGQGYRISNITVNNSQKEGFLGNGVFVNAGVIKNLNLHNVNITGNYFTGAIAGNGGVINNVSVTGSVAGINMVGGLAGINAFVGGGHFPIIKNSHSSASVSSLPVGGDVEIFGGLVGANFGAVIEDSFSSGSVSGSNIDFAGGLVGVAVSSTVEDSYALGNVTSNSRASGFGFAGDGAEIKRSYSTGSVSSSDGEYGFTQVFFSQNPSFENCFWDKDTSGLEEPELTGVSARSTSQMQDINNYTGWSIADVSDFTSEVWKVEEGSYPILRWQ